MVLYMSHTQAFEPNILAKKCGLYTSFYGNLNSSNYGYAREVAQHKRPSDSHEVIARFAQSDSFLSS